MMISKISKVIAVKILGKSIKWKVRIKHDEYGIISFKPVFNVLIYATYLTYNLFTKLMRLSIYDMENI